MLCNDKHSQTRAAKKMPWMAGFPPIFLTDWPCMEETAKTTFQLQSYKTPSGLHSELTNHIKIISSDRNCKN